MYLYMYLTSRTSMYSNPYVHIVCFDEQPLQRPEDNVNEKDEQVWSFKSVRSASTINDFARYQAKNFERALRACELLDFLLARNAHPTIAFNFNFNQEKGLN